MCHKKHLLAMSRLSVPQSVCVNSTPTGQILVKFGTGDIYKNLSQNSKFG
jgi:hypothetical protein